ncbi:hypothetical protein COO60DRAFT_408820 [Scenedesmus sp. NREL 46B-D3]|nr:hypothetical protein COO60DRAFT_408820 [Scenedesmus sp. NREL 46B-D3]
MCMWRVSNRERRWAGSAVRSVCVCVLGRCLEQQWAVSCGNAAGYRVVGILMVRCQQQLCCTGTRMYLRHHFVGLRGIGRVGVPACWMAGLLPLLSLSLALCEVAGVWTAKGGAGMVAGSMWMTIHPRHLAVSCRGSCCSSLTRGLELSDLFGGRLA